MSPMNVCLITDPLVTTTGAVRPALLLAREFCESGHDVTLITSRFDGEIEKGLLAENLHLKDVGPRFSVIRSLPTLDAWGRCLLRHKSVDGIGDSDFVVNTSSCITARAHVYYAQGPMTRSLDDILPDMPARYKYTYHLLRPSLKVLEQRLVETFRGSSDLLIANSEFCASMYREWGIKVDAVMNPPLDCSFFKPETSKPTADYVLTLSGVYGKEGKVSIIKAVADAGVKIKVFGDVFYAPKRLMRHPNVDFLGEVSDEELVHLYSNALYTLFAFNHEPFGYVPLESIACGTPVLTFDRQGPRENLVNGKTGWLASTDRELVDLAVSVWKNGFDAKMRGACREKAVAFDVKKMSKKLIEILNSNGFAF